ncbi:MAG: hypothetical protein ACWGQW_02095 [bacterium]
MTPKDDWMVRFLMQRVPAFHSRHLLLLGAFLLGAWKLSLSQYLLGSMVIEFVYWVFLVAIYWREFNDNYNR